MNRRTGLITLGMLGLGLHSGIGTAEACMPTEIRFSVPANVSFNGSRLALDAHHFSIDSGRFTYDRNKKQWCVFDSDRMEEVRCSGKMKSTKILIVDPKEKSKVTGVLVMDDAEGTLTVYAPKKSPFLDETKNPIYLPNESERRLRIEDKDDPEETGKNDRLRAVMLDESGIPLPGVVESVHPRGAKALDQDKKEISEKDVVPGEGTNFQGGCGELRRTPVIDATPTQKKKHD